MKERLPKRALWFWIAMIFTVAFFFSILSLVIFLRSSVVLPMLLLLIWLMAGFTGIIYAPLYYQSYQYELSKDRLHIRRGIFFVREQWVERDKILLVSLTNHPLTPVVRLSSLVLTTPGSRCMLLTLDTDRARQLAQELVREEEG